MKINYYSIIHAKIIACLLLLSVSFSYGQEDSEISDLYVDYVEPAREVVYVHLNKSIYIKGESIGFKAYVLDKKDKKPSLLTTNLYISIEDENEKVLNQKLIKVEKGVASNIIELDSTFNSGFYTIKAYTNWMRNFNEYNYFAETVRIIDPKAEQFIETTTAENSVDAQFLAEGGHLLHGVINNVGVVLKDSKGYGIASVNGEVRDHNDNFITSFKVNKFGIGRFQLLAEIGKMYHINFSYLNKPYRIVLKEKIEPIGLALTLVKHRNKAIVSFNTNQESLTLLNNKPYTLAIHNGEKISTLDIAFDKELTLLKAFELSEIPSGINILTVFNEKNEPILERLFFNYHDIDILTSSHLSTAKDNDSITLKLKLKHLKPNAFNTLSVSVLPQETASYKRHHNILSYAYLQPFVNGTVENAKYYFTDITAEKKLELDNLLITQGWSSYDWKDIFKPNTNKSRYDFETGIKIKANNNLEGKSVASAYMLQISSVEGPQFFEVSDDAKHFQIDSLFPYPSDRLLLSKFDDKGIIQPTKLYFQAAPSIIPHLSLNHAILKPKEDYTSVAYLNKNVLQFEALNTIQELDEVIVNAELNKNSQRIKELSKFIPGRVQIIGESEIEEHIFLSRFLYANGFGAPLTPESYFKVVNLNRTANPLVFVNDMVQRGDIFNYRLENIDYINIDKGNIGFGKSYGVIKIYTYPGSRREDNRKNKQEFKFPLTFTPKKKYYTPKYPYYNDDFYKGYGTVDWKPELSTDNKGNINFKIAQPQVPTTLFIEGITSDGSFIFEEKNIDLN